MNALFSYFHGPEVGYVDHARELVTFLSSSPPSEGSVKKVRLSVPAENGNIYTLPLKVRIRTFRTVETGECVCQGEVVGGAEHLARLQKDVPAAACREPFLRGSRRLPHRIRVLGRSLPGFHAISVDFSPGGLQVEGLGTLAVGSALHLTLDFDTPGMEPVQCRARVSWCRQEGKEYRAGLAYMELPAAVRAALDHHLSFLESTCAFSGPQRVQLPPEPEPLPPTARPSPPPRSPEGTLESCRIDDREAILVLRSWRGPCYELRFPKPRVVRDQRGLAGSVFADALELEDSRTATAVRRRASSIPLEDPPPLTHYQLINDQGEVIFEVVCQGAAAQTRLGDP
ncbi:MAG: PilZ domain-containing protein [Armatimonadetes bacterium]|nr:PilZ domain-containing protein [Armatimonadota bacterium]